MSAETFGNVSNGAMKIMASGKNGYYWLVPGKSAISGIREKYYVHIIIYCVWDGTKMFASEWQKLLL